MTRLFEPARGLPWLTGLFVVLAYARVLGVESASFTTADADQWLFAPEDTSPGLVIAIAAWLLARRRHALAALPAVGSPVGAAVLLVLCVASFVWAYLNAAHDLLAVALAAFVAGMGCFMRGAGAWRVVALPCVVLLFSIPIPSPLYNEVVWHLQLWSATGAHALLGLVGLDFTLDGVLLAQGDSLFLVIEECSGLRSIRTLLLVAIVIRELLGLSLRGLLVLGGTALPLALLLNVARVALIAGSQDSGGLGDPGSHVGQGLAILAAGTVVLFAIGHRLGGSDRPEPEPMHSLPLPWAALCIGHALLAVVAWTLPPWPVPTPPAPDLQEIPMEHGGWSGTDHRSDRLFTGQLPLGQIVERSYGLAIGEGDRERVTAEIELFVGVDSAQLPRLRPYASKLDLPGRDWALEMSEPTRVWSLSQDAKLVHARRGDERALVYVWALHDEGLALETLRSFFALERGPFARDERRVVVRLSTPLREGELGEHGARRILDRFVGDFRNILAAL